MNNSTGGVMGFFNRTWKKAQAGVFALQTRSSELGSALNSLSFQPRFIVGFVSPYVDIDTVAKAIHNRFSGTPM